MIWQIHGSVPAAAKPRTMDDEIGGLFRCESHLAGSTFFAFQTYVGLSNPQAVSDVQTLDNQHNRLTLLQREFAWITWIIR
jgi:hypothetical protein